MCKRKKVSIDNETKSYDKFYLRVFITIKNNSIGLRFCAIPFNGWDLKLRG